MPGPPHYNHYVIKEKGAWPMPLDFTIMVGGEAGQGVQSETLAISPALDVLIALNRETIDLHEKELKTGGVIVYDEEQTKLGATGERYFPVPFVSLAEKTVQNKL